MVLTNNGHAIETESCYYNHVTELNILYIDKMWLPPNRSMISIKKESVLENI